MKPLSETSDPQHSAKQQERARRRKAMDDLYALEREQGLIDGPPPPPESFKSDGGTDS